MQLKSLIKTYLHSKQWYWGGALALLAVLSATPLLAQNSNFGALTLSPGFAAADGVTQGSTGGSFSLSSLANRDRAGNLCLGYGSSNPDHIITLRSNFAQLNLQVDSGGNDTTLVVEGPGGVIRCGDDTGRSKDASIRDTNWQAGAYRVWVGSIESGARYDYTLRVSQ
jgi:hypothetical protein